VARVGDKVDTHLFCGNGRCAVDHAHEGCAMTEVADDNAPRPSNLAYTSYFDFAWAAGEDVFQRVWVPNR
jgi:hypothetical protein